MDGLIDRSRLAAIVFADTAELENLEAVTHPAIVGSIAERVQETIGPVAVEVPVLLPLDEGPRDGWRRVFVDADEQLRVERAVARGGDEDDVRRRVAAQVDRETWLDWADDVIENNGTVEALEEQVHNLIDDLVPEP